MTRRSVGRRAPLLAALAVCLGGCEGERVGELVAYADSAGVQVGRWDGGTRPVTLSLERSFALGGADDGPESFYQLYRRSVSISPDGLIAVLNRQSHEVAVFDSTGAHRFTRGSEGEGPGEFTVPSTVVVHEGGALDVFDFRKRALVRFGPDGAVLDQLPMTVPFNGYLGITALPEGGHLLMSQTAPRGEGDVVRRVLRMAGADTVQLGASTTTAAIPVRYESCGMHITLPPLFAAELRWASNGDRTVVASDASWSIDVYDGPELERVVRATIEPELVSLEVVERELGEGERWGGGGRECIVPPSEVVEARGHAEHLPIIEAVAVAPDGAIWVLRRAGTETGAGVGDAASRVIDLFSPSGDYLGTASGDEMPFPVAFLPDGRIATIERDDFDIDRLVFYRVTTTTGG